MSQVYVWPVCTFPGCECRRTWRRADYAMAAYQRHHGWTRGDEAICLCHGAQVATFPCDKSEQHTTHA
jgi:hypothetical protein